MKQYMHRYPIQAISGAIIVAILVLSVCVYTFIVKEAEGSASFLGIFLGWQIIFLFLCTTYVLVRAIKSRCVDLAIVASVIIGFFIGIVSLSYTLGIRYDEATSPARENVLLFAGIGDCSSWEVGNHDNLATDYLCALMSVPENNRLLIERDFTAGVYKSRFDHEAAQDIAASNTSYNITFVATEAMLLLCAYILTGLYLQRFTQTYPQKS